MERRWKVLLVTAVAVFMGFLDVTIVNIAFPDIRASFPDDSLAGLSWVLNAYNIVFAALLVPAGRVADIVGRRRLFFVGLLTFLAASAVCGAANSVEMLVAARVVQAVGAAILVPTSLGLLLPEFPLEQRATATALWGATGAVAAATGPSLGGVLVHATDWRLVFFVNIPIGLAALVPARKLLREVKQEGGSLPDALGTALLTLGVAALSLGIVKGPDWGWGDAKTLGSLAAGVILLVALIYRSSTHRAPVFELSLFKVRSFSVAVTGTFLFSLAFYALLLCNILFLTEVWNYSILKAGFAVTPGPLMAAVSAAVAGRISDRYGQRVMAVPGPLVFATGCLMFATTLGSDPHYLTHYLPATILTGTGVGMSFASFSSAAVAELPPTRFATGSAIASCLRQVGAVLGISVLIALLGTSQSLHTFHQAYGLMAIPSAAAGILAVALGRVRARDPLQTAIQPAEIAS
ncbi:MAG TPA: DHA2 family efflux MFS transporter permease subunit [Thermoleophilaceae bacterium]